MPGRVKLDNDFEIVEGTPYSEQDLSNAGMDCGSWCERYAIYKGRIDSITMALKFNKEGDAVVYRGEIEKSEIEIRHSGF
jgi:hypothetical protein